MTDYGVRRLIAINSGNYSYANIDLSKPVHLAAPNNRGKSTLVNALQFLYIDDFNRMQFGRRSHEDTRNHYFGEDRSYLVFECHTTSGIQCLLVRGLSNLRGGSFERYVYDREFREADFVCDSEIRDFDDVRTRLADRHLLRVKSSELWQVLAGTLPPEAGKAIPRMNILPIRRRDEYIAFRDVFVRLLSLTNADAKTLRQLIIDSHARDIGERKIDVAAEYKDEFDRAERSEHELNFIRAVTAEIDKGRSLRLEAQVLADRLSGIAPLIWNEVRKCRRFIEVDDERLNAKNALIATGQRDAERERGNCIERSVNARAQLKLLEQEWAGLDVAHSKWSAYSPELINEMRSNAEEMAAKIAELARHLDQVKKLDLDAMRRRVEQLKRLLATDRQACERWEQTAGAELRRAGVADGEIDAAFRIVNPVLLKLIINDTVTIKDMEATVERIRGIAHHVKKHKYTDDVIEVDVSGVGGPDSEILGNAKQLRNLIALNEEELLQQVSRLEVAEHHEHACAKLIEFKTECERLRRDVADFDNYAKAWHDRAELAQRLAKARDLAENSQREISELGQQLESLAKEEKRIEQERNSLKEQKGRLEAVAGRAIDEGRRTLFNSLPVADENDDHEAARPRSLQKYVESVIGKLSALTDDLRRVAAIREQVSGLQATIASKSREFETQQRYFSEEDEEWRSLYETYDSLAQLEEATRRNWDALSTTLGARLRAIVTAVGSIKTAVEAINRGLKAYTVSNLRAVHIRVEEEHDTFSAVEALSNLGSLFQDPDAIDIAKKKLRLMIDRNEPIELDEMFELRIHIQESNGASHQAASLDEIGSTGTGMTAKAMIFIQLVRAIAVNEKYRLHFYIDGLGELDDRNLSVTAAMAVSRGIVPITADPRLHLESLAHPEVTVYSLGQSPDGRFYVDGHRTYHARRRLETAGTIP